MTHTLLLVDDERAMLRMLERTLAVEGRRIVTADSAERALELVAEGGVDLVISDIEMPQMNGVELLSRIRKTHPEVVRMLLTGGASLDSALRAINDGEVHRYLTKPWDNAALRETVGEALARLDELRRSAGVDRNAVQRSRLLAELEAAYPGICSAPKVDRAHLIDVGPLDALAAGLTSPVLRSLLKAP